MKTFVRSIVALTLAAFWQTGSVVAEDVQALASDVVWASAAADRDSAPVGQLPSSVEYLQCSAQCALDTGCESCGTECGGCDTGCDTGCGGSCWANPCCSVWTFDYQIRTFFNSHTSYEFGTMPGSVPMYAPLSRLDWDLDSTWHGLRIGLEKPCWNVHFEWLTPIEDGIHGKIADYDWLTPSNPSQLDSYTVSDLRWNDGQTLELGGEYKWRECLFGLPIEVWPGAGFRFQRFDMTASGLTYVVPPSGRQPQYDGVDVGTFNQQYYQIYLGGELRSQFCLGGRQVELTFQGDWAGTWGYNVDHHLLYELDGIHRYTMEKTNGGSVHLALITETSVTQRTSLGLRLDHTAIDTTGTHHWVMTGNTEPVDETWSNGVKVKSDQTSITAFLRFCY